MQSKNSLAIRQYARIPTKPNLLLTLPFLVLTNKNLKNTILQTYNLTSGIQISPTPTRLKTWVWLSKKDARNNIQLQINRRANLLKALGGKIRGCCSKTISNTYKSFISPIIEYRHLILTIASSINILVLTKTDRRILRKSFKFLPSHPNSKIYNSAMLDPLPDRPSFRQTKFIEKFLAYESEVQHTFKPPSLLPPKKSLPYPSAIHLPGGVSAKNHTTPLPQSLRKNTNILHITIFIIYVLLCTLNLYK